MTWYLASAPLIPLSSLGYGAGGGAPEEGPSPISKAWPGSGLLSPSLVPLTEVSRSPPPPPPMPISSTASILPHFLSKCPSPKGG